MSDLYYPKCKFCKKNVISISIAGNVFLAAIKMFIGVVGNSTALIADGFHSFSDIVGSAVTWVGMKFVGRTPDVKYPHGYANLEFILSAVINLSLIIGAAFIGAAGIFTIFSGTQSTPSMMTVVVALISVVLNEAMYQHAMCIGNQTQSPATLATAWENRSDAFSSIAIAAGILLAILGVPIMDPIAAIIVAGIITKHSYENMVEACRCLIDSAVDPEMVAAIQKIVLAHKQVKKIKTLRTRYMGEGVLLDMEIKIDSKLTVDKTYEITQQLKNAIALRLQKIQTIRIEYVQ